MAQTWGGKMLLRTLGTEVRQRRLATGLTQGKLAKLANLSRQTVQRLEAGTIQDLSFKRVSSLLDVLGLDLMTPSLERRKRLRGLWMAAKTSSVSYKGELSSDMLKQALASGIAPAGYEAHMIHLFDEAPVELVVMAVEETAQQEDVEPARIWANVARLAKDLGCVRTDMWS
jgi:transcriptional regulator with XRE-family HTH domain